MKTIKKTVPIMMGFFLILTLICGILFPLLISAIAKVLFPKQASGSILTGVDGTKYGSEFVGQQFTEEKYLWGRVMNVDASTFTDENGEPLMYGLASNKASGGLEMEELIARRVEKIRESHPDQPEASIPVDLVTCSGSGLDPEISPAAAEFQVGRIAKARGISEDAVREVIQTYTTGRAFGLLGEPRVHVLKVNLTLDGIEFKE